MADNKSTPRITNKQVYDILHEVKTTIAITSHKVDSEINKNEKAIYDHEIRLRKLEENMYKNAWVAGFASSIFTAIFVALALTFIPS
jgi:hypothetical protein